MTVGFLNEVRGMCFFMKYNEELFNISKQLYDRTIKDQEMNNDERLVNELLQVLLKKFKTELATEQSLKGIVKVKFKDFFFKDGEEGYALIYQLIHSKKFDELANKYCFYLGNRDSKCDSYTHFYEIIWDYKTYFEFLDEKEKYWLRNLNSFNKN